MRWLPTDLLHDNRRMLAKLAVIAAVMFGFGYALVPLYRHICAALGINVLTLAERNGAGTAGSGQAPQNTLIDRSRLVTVEFDANARGPWDFKPEVNAVQVHPGQMVTVMYEFRNRQDRPMAAQAIASYAPHQAAPHFNKLQCFCFSEYALLPGESRRWPVMFYLDPKLPRDVTTITLSYTFFEVPGGKAVQPAAGPAQAAPDAVPSAAPNGGPVAGVVALREPRS